MELKNINEVNEYYQKLNIKPCWDLDSLTIGELNIIANTFDELHKIYPDVVIEEIGDYYSFDKRSRDESIKLNKKQLETKAYAKLEFYIKNPELLNIAEDNIRMITEDMELNEVNVNDEKYDITDTAAEYSSSERKIKFNHKSSDRANELTCHEFGHAVAAQYDLNNDVSINEIFKSAGKERIEFLLSEYAMLNVKEFIAVIFERQHSFYGIQNLLTLSVMKIVDEKVASGKAMSETERIIYNGYNNIGY